MTIYQLTITTPGSPPATRTVTAEPDELAQTVHHHARGLLGSAHVDIRLDTDALTGEITNHGATAGTFALAVIEEDTPSLPPWATEDVGHIAHGYTMADLDHLTRTAIRRRSAYSACDTDERYAAGWHAAAELLLTSEQPPTRRDLIRAAWDSADHETRRTGEHRGHGRARNDGSRSDGATVKFWGYWDLSTRVTPSPESGITDRIALAQIWPRLTPTEQEAIKALATLESYQAAADALGLRYHAYFRRLRLARAHFVALWLEGETPAARWRDRRIQTPDGKRMSTSSHLRRRARARAAA